MKSRTIVKKSAVGISLGAAAAASAPDETSTIAQASGVAASLNGCLFDKSMAFAKFGRMLQAAKHFADVLFALRDSHIFAQIDGDDSAFSVCARDINNFVVRSAIAMYSQFGIEVRPMFEVGGRFAPPAETPPISRIDSCANFQSTYDALIASAQVRIIIQACDVLAPFKSSLANIDALKGGFLETMPSGAFTPIAGFDVKDAYIQHDNARARELLVLFLHKVYTYGLHMYTEYVAPDMSPEQLTTVVRDAIATLRKVPSLSRCDQAFNMIEKSIGKLRENFSTYYADFAQTRSATTIFENFVLDVSKDSKEGKDGKRKSALVARQFQLIVNYYREQAAANPGMRQADTLFEHFAKFNQQLGVQHL